MSSPSFYSTVSSFLYIFGVRIGRSDCHVRSRWFPDLPQCQPLKKTHRRKWSTARTKIPHQWLLELCQSATNKPLTIPQVQSFKPWENPDPPHNAKQGKPQCGGKVSLAFRRRHFATLWVFPVLGTFPWTIPSEDKTSSRTEGSCWSQELWQQTVGWSTNRRPHTCSHFLARSK